MRRCRRSEDDTAQRNPHTEHEYGFSPVCWRRCTVRLLAGTRHSDGDLAVSRSEFKVRHAWASGEVRFDSYRAVVNKLSYIYRRLIKLLSEAVAIEHEAEGSYLKTHLGAKILS